MSMRRPTMLLALIAAGILITGCDGYQDPGYAPVADSLTITMSEGTSVSTAVAADDADGDYLTFTLIDPPAHGYLTFHPDSGSFVYTPLRGFVGVDRFTYRACDGVLTSNLAEVVIVVQQPSVVVVWG